MTSWVLNILEVEDSTASLSNLFQCLTTLTKKFLLCSDEVYPLLFLYHCILFCHWATLIRVCFCPIKYLLYKLTPLETSLCSPNFSSSLILSSSAHYVLGMTGWKAALQRRTLGFWWMTSWPWTSNTPLWQNYQQYPGLHNKRPLSEGQGKWSFFSVQHQWGHIWVLCPL